MESINIRLYHGGQFVRRNNRTTYGKKPNCKSGIALHPNVEEVCYFEFVDWIKNELGYEQVGELWFRKRGYSLHNGRKEIKGDAEIPEFLQAPERDGWHHIYVLHPDKKEGDSDTGTNEGSKHTESAKTDRGGPQGNPMPKSGQNSLAADALNVKSSPTPSSSLILTTSIPTGEFREKLPTKSSKKKKPCEPILEEVINLAEPESRNANLEGPQVSGILCLLNSVGAEDQEPIFGRDEDSDGNGEGSDVLLSDGDYEDASDDDLFNIGEEQNITRSVTASLIGLSKRDANDDVDEDEGEEQPLDIESDVELDDSDDGSIVGSDEEGPQYPTFNPEVDFKGKVLLSKGLKFPSNKILRKAIRHNSIEQGYNYYFLHNNRSRVSVYCAKRCGCPWKKARILKCVCKQKSKCKFKIHCRKLKGEESWQIKTYRPDHICGHQHVNPKVTSQYLAERYLDDFRDDPSWKIKLFVKRARREVQAEIGYYKAYYARVRALKMIFGDASMEYERVWDYVEAIRKYNPGSTAVVKVEGIDKPPILFQRMYVCLKACKEGFMGGCRPIIGVDGAHLKGPYPGIIFTAVGKDGNNNIYPVAWAVVETESADTWGWFLELLKNDISSVAASVTWVHEKEDLTYMSDRQKVCYKV